jgi:DNA repair exonuclease SbcCD ATPase subunit
MDLYRTACVGHVHHPQAWQDEDGDGRLLLVPGSPEHHNFGDIGDHGFWTVELEQRGSEWWPVEHVLHPNTASPRFVSVAASTDVMQDGNFYRVTGQLAPGEEVPDGVSVLATPATVVANRALLQEGTDAEHVLHVWTREHPPEGADSLSVGEDDVADPADVLREYIEAGRELLSGTEPMHLRDYRLVSISAGNFGSYAELEHTIMDGVTLVTGRSCDFVSNGAGKSTLAESVYWALTGRTTKGVEADDVVRRGQRECRVTLRLESPQHTMTVTRERVDGKPSLVVEADGEPLEADSIDALTAQVMRRLGISRDIIRTLSYFSQEDVLLFSRATDTARKEIVRDIVGASGYQIAATLAGQRASAAVVEREKCGIRRLSAEAAIDRTVADLAVERERGEAWDAQRNDRLKAARQAITEAEQAAANHRLYFADFLQRFRQMADARRGAFIQRMNEQLPAVIEACAAEGAARLSVEIDQQRRRVAASAAQLTVEHGSVEAAVGMLDLLPVLRQQMEGVAQQIGVLQREYKETEARLQGLDAEIAPVAAQVQRLEGQATSHREQIAAIESGTCPACGKPASAAEIRALTGTLRDGLSFIEEDMARLNEGLAPRNAEQAALRERLTEIVAQGKPLREQHDEELRPAVQRLELLDRTVQQHVAAYQQLERLNDLLRNVHDQAEPRARDIITARIQRMEQRAGNRLQRYERYNETEGARLVALVEAARASAERVATEVNPYDRACAVHEGNIATLREQIASADEAAAVFAKAERIFRYWERGFGKQGIQSLLMEEIAAAFNETRSRVFPLLTRGVYDVQFSATSTTQRGDSREKTDFIVWYRGEVVPYASLSGGQRKRVDLGVMLTLVLAVAQRQHAPGVLGMMVFDEVFDHLDEDGGECLYAVLEQEVTRTVPAIYAITHDVHLQSLFPRMIRVEQDDEGVSRLLA